MSRFDLSHPAGRRAAHRDFLWNDHAFLRLRFQNAHWISPELVRTNQPSPKQLARWRERGIRTVVNLRGGFESSFYALEKEACDRLGLTLVDFTITSREAPSKVRVRGAKALFQNIQYPALMHCKSGADRAGIMSVMYMHFRQGKPISEALDQLHWRYLHVKAGKTGVLDYVFERYLLEGEPAGVGFLEWVESEAYDPVKIKADFKAQWWANVLTEKLLRRE